MKTTAETGIGSEILVQKEFEVAKIIAFARAGVRDISFRMPAEFLDVLLRRAEQYAHENDLWLSIRIVSPNGDRLLTFGLIGACAGAGIGWSIGGPSGAVVGAGAGLVAGMIIAHVQLTVVFRNEQSDVLVVAS